MRRLFLALIFLFLFVKPAFAANFTTDYNVTYAVGSNASTHVNLDISLTNSTDDYYASQYTIQVGFKDTQNVKASDPDGQIQPKITSTSKGQTIELAFNKRVVGKGNKLNFNLNFDTNEVAENSGDVWEINIPGLSNQSDFSPFNVSVLYPSFLGSSAFIKPDLGNQLRLASGSRLFFSKGDLGSSGISIAFGKFQTYSFNLTYHLENKNLFPIRTELALPPATNYQDIELDDLSPRPVNVALDKDGNWLAQYLLKPSQDVKVVATGKARIYLEPKDEKSSEATAPYLVSQKYWETLDPKISALASKLKTPKGIYQYVVDNLIYDYSRVTSNKPREGAVAVLNDPSSAVCLEFSDLFVTLARAAGIPARELDGFANTKNSVERPLSLVKDVLHAWPEYFDKTRNQWIMVDPTWGNTTNGIDYFNTLDFDHFAFTIKGSDSNYPVPAGGYKRNSDLSTKDVDVEIGQGFNGKDQEDVVISLPEKSLPWIPLRGTVRIRNVGSSIADSQTLAVFAKNLIPDKTNINVPKIPPFGFVDIPISFKNDSVLTNTSDTITIGYGKNKYREDILISPFVFDNFYGGVLILVLFTTLSIAITRSGRVHIPWKIWRNPLRRKS